ncbi:MAG: DUF1553 domain-containing protein [Mariniblastus sp.]
MKTEGTNTPDRIVQALISVVPFLLVGLATSPIVGQDSKSTVDFNRQIKPILSDRCFLCHGPDAETREADLRLDTEEGAYAAIEAGDHESSELYSRITSDDEDDVMPPPDSNLSLSAEEKEILKRWIDEGAKWEEHWSFVAPKQSTPPTLANKHNAANEIDQFILAKLENSNIPESLFPAAQAAKEKLLRRVSFDLTGLPPTLAELDDFLTDDSDDAYETAVDRLLASSRYGERMASDWLDLARYSDTYGYQVDRDRFVWPWRDWVIKAFNQNMTYDRFLTEQLAGDLLPNATDDQILATTFNRLHPQKVEGGSVEEEFRVEYVADRSQTVGMAFMGLTVECARCHDHKYDPISQKEYYQLFAFFNSIDESGLYSYFDAAAIPTPSLLLTDDKTKQELTAQRKSIAEIESKIQTARAAITSEGNSASAFKKWIAELSSNVKQIDRNKLVDLGERVDFEKTPNGQNKIVDGPDLGDGSIKAIQLTGDDEVKLKLGAFKRHQPFTIATRIKLPDNEKLLERTVIYHRSRAWTDSASRGYQLLVEEGKFSASLIHFWPGNAISVRTKRVIPTEKWLHVAFVYDGSSRADGIQIFVDGKPEPVEIIRDHLEKQITGSGTDHLILGARFRDFGFKSGQLADLKVFHRELTDLEIAGVHDKAQFNTELTSADPNSKSLQEFYLTNHDDEFKGLLESLTQERDKLNAMIDGLREIMVMKELPQQRQAYVLHRGAYDAPREKVAPNTLAAFPPLPKTDNANRLTLAKWMTLPEHPLTARVAVNHYWQLCFGSGLVRTPEDFGSQGQPPTHPKLLDWLAVDFQQSGWDIKRLLKKIVMSRTYQQSTSASKELLKLDPDNELLARAPTYRLPAEMLRDNVLATSGLLVEKIGGVPVRPYELAVSFQPAKPDKGEGLYRRSIYTYWKRTGPAPVMLTLDAAKRDVCQVKRERTSSPLAALVQLNNPQTVEASRKLAEKVMADHRANEESKSKITTDIFRTLTSRFPTEKERGILESLFDSQLKYFEDNETATNAFLAVGDSKSTIDTPAALAAWSSVVNTLFSFDECVMKR